MRTPGDPAVIAGSKAFVPDEQFVLAPTGDGILDGLCFAAKDLLDIEGHRTGGGNPQWRAAARPAKADTPAIRRLRAAGATLIGKTITDELAFSLEGANAHYGTPINPRNPDWLPGGSSSGSAVAVASGACDFALGTDTGGSVRVPAAFCGVAGFRPSHGAIALNGVLPFAPSYDTIGWFARDAQTLKRVGDALLPQDTAHPIRQIRLAEDALACLDDAVASAILRQAEPIVTGSPVRLFEEISLQEVMDCYRVIQGYEITQSLGQRIADIGPVFGASIAERFSDAATIEEKDYKAALTVRRRFSDSMTQACGTDMALIAPISPVACLPKNSTEEKLGAFYTAALGLTALAGHPGFPQIQLSPKSPDCLIGMSLIAGKATDRSLLALGRKLST